ncbi:hypothetical protein [Streptomyces sp. NPDC056144]|uniref:hypothetical protein n=1 Tax=unclassified Streptomyces TaxID=2593676 RepID=UPI0035D88665
MPADETVNPPQTIMKSRFVNSPRQWPLLLFLCVAAVVGFAADVLPLVAMITPFGFGLAGCGAEARQARDFGCACR